MNINLQRKVFCVFGLRGTGKSTFANHIAESFGTRGFVYDTLGEAPESARYLSYIPRDKNSAAELEQAIVWIVANRPLYRFIMIDECNRFAPSKPAPLPPNLADLNDQCRHYGITVGYIARRPVQLNQDLTELADYLFIFRLKGIRDIRYLDDLSAGLGDAVLSLKGFQFVMVLPDRSYRVQNPVQPSKTWLESAARHLKAAGKGY